MNNNSNYKIIENYKDAYNEEDFLKLIKETDYFDKFDYIIGDYSYDKLRLKGFYKETSKDVNDINNIKNKEDYINNYCSYGCKYFVVEKTN